MRRNMIRAGLASLVAAGAVAALPGIASAADVTPDLIGGRERVKVTVISTAPTSLNCDVYIDGPNGQPQASFPVVTGGKQSIVISQVAPGMRSVRVLCLAVPPALPPAPPALDVTRQVSVDLANPALDAIDSVFISAGSSALATDAALR
ncbi:hypothetical protein OIE68_40090 [Nocardia vinacea]|uniref:hypothetical protein n=1 Tax=Nocardia vinacea TaxID=96468 RepID=UPI002E13CA38|nr:hypothetical protein OIE68_40090 [Nocardia vinacea]